MQGDNSSLLHPTIKEGNMPHPYRSGPNTEASYVLHDGRAHNWITDLIKCDILNCNGQKYKVDDQVALSYIRVTLKFIKIARGGRKPKKYLLAY